jgi:hypothetical protein
LILILHSTGSDLTGVKLHSRALESWWWHRVLLPI